MSCDYVDCLHLFASYQQYYVIVLYQSINTRPLIVDKTPIPTMHTLPPASQNHILSLLDAGNSAKRIAASTGYGVATISRLRSKHRPHLSKSSGGRPPKLSTANIRFAQRLIRSGKADTAVDVTRALCNVTNQSVHAQTVHCSLKLAGMKAVVKSSRNNPFFPGGIGRRGCTLLRDTSTGLWRTGRRLCGLMKLKSTGWGQMGGSGSGKRVGRA